MTAQELLFLAHYLKNDRKVTPAADAVGITKRTGHRWVTKDYPVGRWLMEEAQAAFQTIALRKPEMEDLLVDALVEGITEGEAMDKGKAADLITKVLGLDRGGSEHDITPETRALLGEMAVAFTKVAAGGQAAGVEESRLPAEPGGDALPPGDDEDRDPGGRGAGREEQVEC